MGVQPWDQLLEIGCGNGVSVEMLCETCPVMGITAIDRSAKMIERACARNIAHIETRRVRFLTASLAELRLDEHFGKIFAVNVNVFWMKPERELHAVRNLLAPGGSLFLFYQPPAGSSTEALRRKLNLNLEQYGFIVLRDGEIHGDAVVTSCTEAKPA